MDYYSNTHHRWLTATVVRAEPLTLNVKPNQSLSAHEQRTLLRLHRVPDKRCLKWVGEVIGNGRIEREAMDFFFCYAVKAPRSNLAMNVVMKESFNPLSRAVDMQLGSVNSLGEFLIERKGHLTWDDFLDIFWRIITTVHRQNRPVLPSKQGKKTEPSELFDFQDTLSEGPCFTAKLALDKRFNEGCMVKIVRRKQMTCSVEDAQLDIMHLRKVRHGCVAWVYECCDDNSFVYFASQHHPGRTLLQSNYSKRHSGDRYRERYIAELFRGIMFTLNFLHGHGVIHADLHSGNVILTEELADLEQDDREQLVPGFMLQGAVITTCFAAEDGRCFAPVTPKYAAPELWVEPASPKADIFSCGVMLFEMLSAGKLPLDVPQGEAGARFWFSQPQVDWELLRPCSSPSEKLCRHMMSFHIKSRPPSSWCGLHPFLALTMEEAPANLNPAQSDDSLALDRLLQNFKDLPHRSSLFRKVAYTIASRWVSSHMPIVKSTILDFNMGPFANLSVSGLALLLEQLNVPHMDAELVAEAMDIDRDGQLSLTEILAAAINPGSREYESHLWDFFHHEADKDRDGFLSQDELASLMPEESDEQVHKVFLDMRRLDGKGVDWATFTASFSLTIMSTATLESLMASSKEAESHGLGSLDSWSDAFSTDEAPSAFGS